MLVGTVQPSAWKALQDPGKERFVIGVHPKRYLRLPPVPPEVTLPNEDAYQQPDVERIVCELRVLVCFTVRSHVEPSMAELG